MTKRAPGRPVGTKGIKHKKPGDLSAGIISDFEALRRDAFCKRTATDDLIRTDATSM